MDCFVNHLIVKSDDARFDYKMVYEAIHGPVQMFPRSFSTIYIKQAGSVSCALRIKKSSLRKSYHCASANEVEGDGAYFDHIRNSTTDKNEELDYKLFIALKAPIRIWAG